MPITSTNTEPIIRCPHCREPIKLTESLAAPIVEAQKRAFQARLAEKEAEAEKARAAAREAAEAMKKKAGELDAEIARRVAEASRAIAAEEATKARGAVDLQMEEMRRSLEEQGAKLAEAKKAEAALMRKARELEEQKAELDLQLERRLAEELGAARAAERKLAEEEIGLRVAEKDQTIDAMRRQIDELKRKAEQGSQQLQGEVQELSLEAALRAAFPGDAIAPVPKGEHGGDVIQRVRDSFGRVAGTILWESKRTKHWSDGWLPKLREDARAARADASILLTQVLPKEMETFGAIDGVWVTGPRTGIPLAMVLRAGLLEVASARAARAGQQTKTEMVYAYLTGPEFARRVSAIVEAFTTMQDDLEKEKRAITKQWEKRRKQLDVVIAATSGMYGDLSGIAGSALGEIPGLGLALPAAALGAGDGAIDDDEDLREERLEA